MTPAKAAPKASLTIGFLQLIDSLNPYIGINDPSYLLYGLLYDYAFSFDEHGTPIPNIVTQSTHDAAGFNWTYTIRQGVYWSDG
ncbi:MAG TPA: ABC transporter substrate-binding protein, partial [Thermoplasmata archaeon]|nr:ABC transporter substrate-binding protein [Thermoplasmata archaeon]